jgi:hypothetical protein
MFAWPKSIIHTANKLRRRMEDTILEKHVSGLSWRHPPMPCSFSQPLPHETTLPNKTTPLKSDTEMYDETARLLLFCGEIRMFGLSSEWKNGVWHPATNMVYTCFRCANAIFERIAIYANLQLHAFQRNLTFPIPSSNVPIPLQNLVRDVIASLWFLRFACQQQQISIDTFDLLINMRE